MMISKFTVGIYYLLKLKIVVWFLVMLQCGTIPFQLKPEAEKMLSICLHGFARKLQNRNVQLLMNIWVIYDILHMPRCSKASQTLLSLTSSAC